jgi:hypothetical protein
MTIKGGLSIHLACGWPKLWMRSARRSNGTWTRKKRGFEEKQLGRLAGFIDRRLDAVQSEQEEIRKYVKDIEKIAATPEPGEDCANRRTKFEKLIDEFKSAEDLIRRHMVKVMISFLAGLFVGGGMFEEITDNLDLERWFRLLKSHERRIDGHCHARVGIVEDGATMAHASDAHAAHPGQFTADDLISYRTAREPPCQNQAINRRKVMRIADIAPNWAVLGLFDLDSSVHVYMRDLTSEVSR